MKINRLELIQKLTRMVADREAAAEKNKAEAVDQAAGAERAYLDEHTGDWSTFATTIRARVRQGKAITIGDVPEGLKSGGNGWRATVGLFTPHVVRDSEFVARTEPLTRLIAVLEACPDEFVTDSSLARIGAPIKELMRP